MTVLSLTGTSGLMAQDRTVSGRVTSAEDGSPLPGVNVVLKGTQSGTVTDVDGNYRLAVPGQPGEVLVFTFIGLQTQEVEIQSRTVVDIRMQTDVTQLSEVIVTAVGVEREARALGYSVENVSATKVQQVAEIDPLRALQGKVAGVNISGTSGAPGSSTRMTIRGNTSLLGENQPLFVVDGIPYNNAENSSFNGLANGAAYSSRFSDIDPNNIESITVLKGGAAAALYGTRAANGVVVITTKSGKSTASKKGLEVSYSSQYAVEKIGNLPDFQNRYGTGSNFSYAQANGSWGAPFPGTVPYQTIDQIPHWYNNRPGMEDYWGTFVPYRAYPNNVKDLFQNGSLFENSLTVSGGNETSNLSVTLTRSTNEGYVPNTEFDKTNISVGGRTILANKLIVGASLQYTKSFQRAVQSGVGLSGSNNNSAFARALFMGRNWDLSQPYQNPVDNGSEFMVARSQADNPYWSYENAGVLSDVNRIFATTDFAYDVNDWLNFTYKIGINAYNQSITDFIRPGSTGPSSNPGAGRVVEDYIGYEEIESNFIVNFTPTISDDISLSAFIGHNVNQRTTDRQSYQGIGYVTFDIDDIDNTNAVTPFGGDYERRRIFGVFADATLGYRDWAFLNVTARNDWSSTLPKSNNSFFYPAASLSVILTEALDIESNFLNFLKLRVAGSQVGKDTDPYQLVPVYLVNPPPTTVDPIDFPFRGVPGASLSNVERDPNLKPERTRDYEFGVDAKVLDNRVGISATYYKRRSFDQIAPISLPSTSGFNSYLTNFGEVSNEGIEVSLDVTPVRLENSFTWNIYGTFTHNKNVIEELTAGTDEIQFGAGFAGGVISTHRPGQEYGLLLGTVAARDDEGNLLIDPSNGQLLQAFDRQIIGNPNPDFIVGLSNSFSYKGIRLGVVLEYKQGGDLYSNTVQSLLGRGVLKTTENREMNVVIPGVYGDATTLEPIRTEGGQKIPNTTMIEQNSLWFGTSFAINGLDEYSVYDATWVKLREISLGYDLPRNLLANTPIGSASISLTGRNLWFKAPNMPEATNFDPEINQFGASNQQGIEWAAAPSVKRYAVTLRVTF